MPSIQRLRLKTSLLLILAFMTLILSQVWTACGGHNNRLTELDERFDPGVEDYAFVLPELKPVKGVPGKGLRARDCGTCHTDIYKEWKRSTHASALQDIQFQSELTKPDSPRWLCLNCHIPTQNQREYVITGLIDNDIFRPIKKPNPNFDPVMQQEGITCATCHIRQDPESGESIIIGPYASNLAPHPTRKTKSANRNHLDKVCLRCHDPRGQDLTPNLVCWFDSRRELEGDAAKVKQTFGRDMGCIDCHMSPTRRRAAPAFKNIPVRKARKHNWVGGGVPKWYAGYDDLLRRGYKNGLLVEVAPLPVQDIHSEDPVNTSALPAPRITLKNNNTGHWLPTGDPERFILVIARLLDTHNRKVAEARLRIGQTWLWNPARKVGDNRLKHGESRLWRPALKLSEEAGKNETGPGVKLVIMAYNVKLSTASARYIQDAKNVNEAYLKNGAELVRNAGKHYPFASLVFREDIRLKDDSRRSYSPKELIEFSKKESGKRFELRDY